MKVKDVCRHGMSGEVYRAGEYGSYYWRVNEGFYSAGRWSHPEGCTRNLEAYLDCVAGVVNMCDRSEYRRDG